ncbi:MAG: SEC-C metal-binding domain-containing protein, partial [Pirellulaceae bacterium]
GPWVKTFLEKLGMQEGERIESRMVTRRIEGAQKKVEERNFEVRKNLLEYDEVMDEQRKRVYGYRQQILDGVNCRDLILQMLREQVDHQLTGFLKKDYGVESYARWAGTRLSIVLDPRDFRGMDPEGAERFAKSEAERMAETQVIDAIEENLPDSEEESEWNWDSLAKMAHSRWGLNVRDRDLKKTGRDHVAELLIQQAREAIDKVDLSEGAIMLHEDFGLRTTAGWVKYKFGLDLDPATLQGREAADIKEMVVRQAEAAYDRKEAEYPVMAGLYRFTTGSGPNSRLDREALAQWASTRFETQVDTESFRHKQREEVRQLLLDYSLAQQQRVGTVIDSARQEVDRLFANLGERPGAALAGNTPEAEQLSKWLAENIDFHMQPAEIARIEREELERRVVGAIEDHFRPEMRMMERHLLLEIVDTAWKDHLLAMDHLRSSVGLSGYAQMDPKVEYKREGMRMFDQMWTTLGERVTDLIFRMEQLNEEFVSATWVETAASHATAQSASEISQQQDAALSGKQGEVKIETIRHRGERVGRNDPCPCGSGRKYKQCCMRSAPPAA